jgi:NADH-quinone oxidoreductase subunit E
MAVLMPELRAEAERIVARYPEGRERSAIMPLLYLVQSVEGQVTREGLREVADLLGLTTAEVEAVATFYTMIRLRRTGTYVVSVCTNLSCALRGAREVYERGRAELGLREDETTDDGVFTLHEEECLGACDAAPVVTVNFANFDRVTPDAMAGLLATIREGGTPTPARGEFPGDFKAASRILAGLEPPDEREGASGSPPRDGGSGGSSSEREGASGSPPRDGGSGGSSSERESASGSPPREA